MAEYHEQVLKKAGKQYVVCVPHTEFSKFYQALIAENKRLGDLEHWSMTDGRPLVKRRTKGSIPYEDFINNWF